MAFLPHLCSAHLHALHLLVSPPSSQHPKSCLAIDNSDFYQTNHSDTTSLPVSNSTETQLNYWCSDNQSPTAQRHIFTTAAVRTTLQQHRAQRDPWSGCAKTFFLRGKTKTQALSWLFPSSSQFFFLYTLYTPTNSFRHCRNYIVLTFQVSRELL